MPAFGENLFHLGKFFLGYSLEPEPLCLKVNHEPHGEVVENCRKGRRNGYVDISDSDELGHDESGRSHDGGHELPSRGCRGLHGACELCLVSDALHEGDGECAGGDHVCHGAARYGAEKAAGHDRNLCGSSNFMPCGRKSEVDKEFAQAGFMQEGPEEDEEVHEGGGDSQGHSQDSLGGHVHVGDDPGVGEPSVGEHPGEIGPKVGIGEEDYADDRDGEPDNPAGRFEH